MAMFESRLLSKCSPDFLAAGESAVSVARAYLSCGPPTIARAEVELVAPVTRMDKVMVVMMMGMMMIEEDFREARVGHSVLLCMHHVDPCPNYSTANQLLPRTWSMKKCRKRGR